MRDTCWFLTEDDCYLINIKEISVIYFPTKQILLSCPTGTKNGLLQLSEKDFNSLIRTIKGFGCIFNNYNNKNSKYLIVKE